MKSLWRKECGDIVATMDVHQLIENQEIKENIWDVIVIGAGITGILTAYLLKEQGFKVIVLEGEHIASGQTERTTAKITSQHGLKIGKLVKDIGEEKARLYLEANEMAIKEYQRIIVSKNIECEFEKTTSYIYSKNYSEDLLKEVDLARKFGVEAYYTTKTELPFQVKGAVAFPNQARFQPLSFIRELSKELCVVDGAKVINIKGKKVYIQAKLEDEDRYKLIHHPNNVDVTLKGENIVVATHFPLLKYKGFYFMRQHQERSYVIAIEGVDKVKGMYYGIDEDGLSVRSSGEYLLLGGVGYRTGDNSTGSAYEKLIDIKNKYYREGREVARWSAEDCMPHAGVPYIGRYGWFTKHMYVATGYQKWGMSTAMVAAMLIRDAICKKYNPYQKVFTPHRFYIKASIGNMMKDVWISIKGVMKGMFRRPKETSDIIECGSSGIVSERGRTYACHKEENGRVHMISHRCTHMGCEVVWNKDEKSWDCPCHGSRYDVNGRVLDGPARKDISGIM